MSVAQLNRKTAVGKTPHTPHLVGQWARKGKQVTLIDTDPQGSARDWSEQRVRRSFDRHFGVIGLARDTLHGEAPELPYHADHIIIAGPPRVAALSRSALLARDGNGGFATRPRNAKSWTGTPDRSSSGGSAADRHMARLTVDITPALRGRIKIAAFHRGITMTDMLRDQLAREFLKTDGDRS